jgi:hypothetical protein
MPFFIVYQKRRVQLDRQRSCTACTYEPHDVLQVPLIDGILLPYNYARILHSKVRI